MIKGDAYKKVLEADLDVFNHNIETVPRLYAKVRPGARYFSSLELLKNAKQFKNKVFTKSGIMAGLGENKEEFFRTKNRKDFILPPPIDTLCDKVIKSGKKCFGIGKIADIFGHRGISKSISGMPDDKLFDEMLNVIEKANTGDLIFANFVEFDTLYGHRRDVSGYARALEKFDKKLPKLFSILNREDFLVITADHGNDPSFSGKSDKENFFNEIRDFIE